MKLNNIGNNQTEIVIGNRHVLFSYNTPVAFYEEGKDVAYKTHRFWSNTTSRHIGRFVKDFSNVLVVDQEYIERSAK